LRERAECRKPGGNRAAKEKSCASQKDKVGRKRTKNRTARRKKRDKKGKGLIVGNTLGEPTRGGASAGMLSATKFDGSEHKSTLHGEKKPER